MQNTGVLTMKISVKLGLVSRAVCSSFHSLATSSPRHALTGPDLQHCDYPSSQYDTESRDNNQHTPVKQTLVLSP
jgi:hypothetical protein